MTNETELRDRVHEVLYNHRAIASGPGDCVCACNRTWVPNADHRAHVAQAIINEFGLTVETKTARVNEREWRDCPCCPTTEDRQNRVVGKWEKQ